MTTRVEISPPITSESKAHEFCDKRNAESGKLIPIQKTSDYEGDGIAAGWFYEMSIENKGSGTSIRMVRTLIDSKSVSITEGVIAESIFVLHPGWLTRLFGVSFSGRVEKAKRKIQALCDQRNMESELEKLTNG